MSKGPVSRTISQYIEHQSEINYMVDGKCNGCNSCCSIFSPINLDELKILKRKLSKKLIKNYLGKFDGINAYCPFSVEGQCVVYDVRPLVCKSYACDKGYLSHTLELLSREMKGENKYRILEILPDGEYKDILYEVARVKFGYKKGGNK